MPALSKKRNKKRLVKAFQYRVNKPKPNKGKPKPPTRPPSPPLYTPGRPGVANKPIKPFMTAEDMLERAGAEDEFNQRLQTLDFDLTKQRADTEHEKSQLDRSALKSRSETNDLMASRGLFRSSIRDAELFDIDATAAIRKNFLDRELDTSVLNAQTQKMAATKAWDDFQSAMNQQMAENAREAGEGMPRWAQEPVAPQRNPEHQAAQAQYLADFAAWLKKKNQGKQNKSKPSPRGKGKPGYKNKKGKQ